MSGAVSGPDTFECVEPMLVQCLRRWTGIKPQLYQHCE